MSPTTHNRVVKGLCNKVLKVVGVREGITVGLHEPEFTGNESAYVRDCVDSGWVSSVGAYVDRFEVMLAEYTGAEHAVAIVNGTSALHLALLLTGVSPGDEVLIPALSFVATANAVSHCGAVPHFIDVEEETLGVDPDKLAFYLKEHFRKEPDGWFNRTTGRRVGVVVPMHAFGHPVRMNRLQEVAREFGLKIVEDAAEGIGSFRDDKHVGLMGELGVLSFNGNKVVTTGGGGAIICRNPELAARAKHLSTTARCGSTLILEHDEVAFNYRMPNINAALGCGQMERLDDTLVRKRKLADRYIQEFQTATGGFIFREPAGCRSNYWLNVLITDKASDQGSLLTLLNEKGVMARGCWRLLSELPMYEDHPQMDLSVSESLAPRIINLPSSPQLQK